MGNATFSGAPAFILGTIETRELRFEAVVAAAFRPASFSREIHTAAAFVFFANRNARLKAAATKSFRRNGASSSCQSAMIECRG